MLADRIAQLPEPDHEPARARELADEILSGPEYRSDGTDDPVGRVVEWFGDRFGDLLSGLTGGGTLPAPVAWALLTGLLVLVALTVWRARGRWARRATPAAAGARVVVGVDEAQVQWGADADRAAAEGRWRDALRCHYRALVVDLAAAGVLGDLAGRTTGELTADLARQRPAAAGPFAAATDLFEATWYGGRPAGPSDVDRLVQLAADVRARAPGGAPRRAAAGTRVAPS